MKLLALSVALLSLFAMTHSATAKEAAWVVYEGSDGSGHGKHIVLVSGDEEYRSEEALPQLGKILAVRHGFKCTVLFAINPDDGTIDPNVSNIPGLESLKSADLMILFTRFRSLPDEQMQHIVDYVESGRPILGMRTATHAFNIKGESKFAHYSWRSKAWDGGFGRQVLGETWINHHGSHGKQSTRGIVADDMKDSPLTRGIADGDVWGPTDVYGVRLPLPGDSRPVIYGQVLTGMKSDDQPLDGAKNDPMMPVAWTKSFKTEAGKTARVFCTTMGASQDLSTPGTRRMLVNGVYWCLGMEKQIPAAANVDIVGEYNPTPFGFNKFTKGIKPAEHELKK